MYPISYPDILITTPHTVTGLVFLGLEGTCISSLWNVLSGKKESALHASDVRIMTNFPFQQLAG